MTNPAMHDSVPPRSTFVTVLAWLFIVLSGFATLVSIMQNAMMAIMPFDDHLDGALRDSTFSSAIPPMSQFLFTHFRALVLVTLVVCVVTLITSIGLLRRQNWARIIFILLLALGIANMLGSLFFQSAMMPDVATLSQDSTLQRARDEFGTFMRAMRIFMLAIVIGVSALFGWIIARLLSPTIRAEFSPPGRAA